MLEIVAIVITNYALKGNSYLQISKYKYELTTRHVNVTR